MRQYCFFVFVLACASASTVQDSNNYMDLVLEQHMPHLVMGNHDLYPGARIPDFNFKILKTRITNRDLKANITDGLIHGIRQWRPPFGKLRTAYSAQRKHHRQLRAQHDRNRGNPHCDDQGRQFGGHDQDYLGQRNA
ncbi:hypothetical protein MTO96_019445 [Rhipicephalus appendiculatus]